MRLSDLEPGTYPAEPPPPLWLSVLPAGVGIAVIAFVIWVSSSTTEPAAELIGKLIGK